MNNLELLNIFYRQNTNVPEYMDICIETNLGMLKYNITSLDFRDCNELSEMIRAEEIDKLREKYGNLYINEVRITYDNNMYLLISEKFILAIEYVLNSVFEHSVQEFSIIQDIQDLNKTEFDNFKELNIVNIFL